MAELDSSVDSTPLTADEASREIVADLTREILYGDEASIQKLVAEKPSVARRMLETIKSFINKLRGVNDPAVDQLNKARGLFEKALTSDRAMSEGKKQYLIVRTTDGGPAVTIEEDILDGIPKSEWLKRTATVLKERFSSGLPAGNDVIRVNDQSRGEYTRAGYSTWLKRSDKNVFADKMRSAANTDEIVTAARDTYVNEPPKHPRKDHLDDFARGEVTLNIADRWYNAEVVIGHDSRGWVQFHDLVNMKAIPAKTKKTNQLVEDKTSLNERVDLNKVILPKKSILSSRKRKLILETLLRTSTIARPSSISSFLGQKMSVACVPFGERTEAISSFSPKCLARLR